MKKPLATSLILFSSILFSIAQQTVASEFYLMKNMREAEFVLKAINTELKFSETEFTKVKDLLFASALSQEEQFKLSPDAEKTNAIKARQTAHIENSLKTILGDKFAIYNQKKAAIEVRLKELKKN